MAQYEASRNSRSCAAEVVSRSAVATVTAETTAPEARLRNRIRRARNSMTSGRGFVGRHLRHQADRTECTDQCGCSRDDRDDGWPAGDQKSSGQGPGNGAGQAADRDASQTDAAAASAGVFRPGTSGTGPTTGATTGVEGKGGALP